METGDQQTRTATNHVYFSTVIKMRNLTYCQFCTYSFLYSFNNSVLYSEELSLMEEFQFYSSMAIVC
ncbi:hypothetical protein T4B_9652 [Trichinella pseudospiralis]|uniref:Uncharacterized protein n=1 Tax=Trichinella pseudospiralis TaxID=6337 RepID=A0A0V1EB41_TRIPS|nr:hypothetical protein T4A_8822 [Trichinella pseudospiralis]KRZ19728.1 hypothetical protein T4B_9652 [Trichinella pseudospiralis]KRZ36934.1 hypothetical protein T4C_12578 [Trichinella pseudospiralis]